VRQHSLGAPDPQPDCPSPEGIFGRFDFNGDALVWRYKTSDMPFDHGGAVGSATPLTDLEVLASQWTSDLERAEGWTKNKLDELMTSADLEIHADDLFDAGARDVEVKMTSTGGTAIPTRHVKLNLQREKSYIVATVPASSGPIELEASATVAGETIKAAPLKIELKLGEDKRIDLCKGLEVTATPAELAADGKQKSSIVAQLHKCSDVGVAGRPIAWAVDNAAGGSLTLTEAATNAEGKAKATFTVGTTPGTYKVKATVTLDQGVTETAEATIKVGPPIKIKYVWQQHIVDWTQSGTTRWTDAPPGMPDCTTPGVVDYCIDEFNLTLLSEENGGLKREGSVEGGGNEFTVTQTPSNHVLKSKKEWELTLTNGTTHTGDATATFAIAAGTPIANRPLKSVSASFAADGVRVAGLQEVGDLPYVYTGSYFRTGTGPDPIELHTGLANLLLVPQPNDQHIRFAAKPGEEIVFPLDPVTESYGPFQSCGKLDLDLQSVHGYYVEDPAIPGLPATILGRQPIYTPGARPMPVGPGHLLVSYAFGAVVEVDGNVLPPTLPDCSVNNPPTGKFDAPQTTLEGRPTKFEDGSTDIENDIESWQWDFGDGEPGSTEQSPYHTFPDNGTYTVTLTVKDREGATDSTSKQIVVENQDPLAFIEDSTAEQGTTLEFSLGMSDPGKVDKQQLEWTVTSTNPTWPTLSNTEAAFIGGYSVMNLPAGIYPVTLTVKDKDNGTTTAVATMEVTEAPPPPCDPVTGANCPPQPPPVLTVVCGPTPPQLDGEEAEFFDLVNAYRIQNGVPPLLGVSPTLQDAATEHAHDMAVNDFMDHTGSDGRGPAERAHDAGYPESASLAENIASGAETAFEAIFAWQTSTTGHNENMLNPAWKSVGIAREEGNGTMRWATTYGSELDCPASPPPPPAPAPAAPAPSMPLAAASAEVEAPAPATETGPGVETIQRTETVEPEPAAAAQVTEAAAPAPAEAPPAVEAPDAEEPSYGPGAALTISNLRPIRRHDVTFTNRSRDEHGVPIAATIDFGDSSPAVPLAADESTAHSYASTGLYLVTLTATDDAGRSSSVARTVAVLSPPTPQLAYTGATQGVAGRTIAVAATLTDFATTNPVAGATITFTLGSATATATTGADGVASATLDVSGFAPGSHTVRFAFAGNDDYGPREGFRNVQLIANAAPTAHAGGPYVLGSGGTLLLDGGLSTDPDSGDSVAGWNWDLNGDGTTDVTGRTPRPLFWDELQTMLCTVACAPNQDYPIRLTVTDSRGEPSSPASSVVRFASDFALLLGNETKTVVPGQANHFAVTVVGSSDFHTPVTLSAIDLPAGVTATFSVNPVTPPGVSIMTLTASAGAANGTFPVRVRGTAGGITHEVSEEVVVAFGLIPICFGAAQGTVVDTTGAPIAGVRVTETRSFTFDTTDASGRFILRKLPLGLNNAPSTVPVTATKAGYWDATATGPTSCGSTTQLSLTMTARQTGRVSGVITEGVRQPSGAIVSTGAPVPSSLVLFNTPGVFDGSQVANADANGAYTADLRLNTNNTPRSYVATASAPGYWFHERGVTAEAAVPKQADFILVKQCTGTLVGGTVRYADGSPVANHLVGFDPNGSGFTTVSTRTDAQGNFTLNRVELLGHNNTTRTMFLRIFAEPTDPPGTQTSVHQWQLTTCGEQSTRDFVFHIPVARRGTFEGTVLDEETRAPIADVLIFGYADTNLPGNTAPISVRTDANGNFRVENVLVGYDVTTAVRSISVSKTGYYVGNVTVTLRADQTTRLDTTLLRQRFGLAQGVIRDAVTRQPIGNARLAGGFSCSFFCAETDGNGSYSANVTLGFRNAPVSANVVASADGYWPQQKLVAAAAGVTTTTDYDLLRKCTPAKIVGTVVNAVTQQPIHFASVTGGGAVASTDVNGRFELIDVQPGANNNPLQVLVNASAPGFISQSKLVTVFCGATIVVNFGSAQSALGIVVGTVTDADTGQPLANAFVGGEFGGSATTDALGNYRITGVPLGDQNADREWSITATPAGYRPKSQVVTVKANVEVRADFSFSKLGNNRPVATAQSVTVDENDDVDVTFAGTDADGDRLEFTIASHPAHGTLNGAPPNVTYFPDDDYDGPDSFTYTAYDGQDLSEPATVTIDVRNVNRPPVARVDEFTTTAGTPVLLDVLANDTDPDGGTLSVVAVIPGSFTHGTLEIVGNKVRYTPEPGFEGDACFQYTMSDGQGGTATTFVCVEVLPGEPSAPACAAATFSTPEDTALTNALVCTGGSGPLNYALAGSPSHGSVVLAPSGSFTYTPAGDYHGPDSFTFTASDGTSTSEPATASITVTPANDAPSVVDDEASVDEDGGVVVDVLGNDSAGPANESSQTLTLSVASAPSHGSALVLTAGVDAGKVLYTPAPDFNGSDSFSYTACDDGSPSRCGTATVAVTVAAVNDPPVVALAATPLVLEGGSADLHATASDVDGDSLTYTWNAGSGTISGSGADVSLATVNGPTTVSVSVTVSDGHAQAVAEALVQVANVAPTVQAGAPATADEGESVSLVGASFGDPGTSDTHTATVDWGDGSGPQPAALAGPAVQASHVYTSAGVFTVTVTVTDGDGDAGSATTTMTIVRPNRAPTASDSTVTTQVGVPVAVTLQGADPDGDALTYEVLSQPAHGTLSGIAPALTYTPAADYAGPDSFTFEVSDGERRSNTATVSITVERPPPVNHAPTASDSSVATTAGVSVEVPLQASDPDGDALTYTLVAGPEHGLLSGVAPALSYTPAAGYTGADSFTFKVSDGELESGVATVSITVAPATPENDAPIATDASVTTSAGTAVGVALQATDPDGDELTYEVRSGPAHGTLSGDAPDLTYTPAAGYTGPDSFTWVASDGRLESNTATVTITVLAANRPPVAQNGTLATDEDTARALVLDGSDPDLDALTYTVVSGPAHGALDGTAPNLTYTPAANFHGADSLTFRVSDGELESAVATIAITVAPVNDAPACADLSVSTPQKKAVSARVSCSDVEGDALTMSISSAPGKGTATMAADGSFTYTPGTTFVGTDSFAFRASDGAGVSAPATVTVSVLDTTRPSCRFDYAGTTPSGQPIFHAIVRDTGSGIAHIGILQAVNVTVSIPPFAVGTTAQLRVVQTDIDKNKPSMLEISVTDVAGNRTTCDPITTTLRVTRTVKAGRPAVQQSFGGIPQIEHRLEIFNGRPGLTRLDVIVNGRLYRLGGLRPKQHRYLNVERAMRPGRTNTITLRGYGKRGASALVRITD
jgi:uncharacterized protein YkwD